MDEEQETKEEAKEETVETIEDAKHEEKKSTGKENIVDKAEANAKRIEAANLKQEELLKRQENIIAKQILAGKSIGGNPEKKPELTDKEYAEQVLKGEKNPLSDDGFI